MIEYQETSVRSRNPVNLNEIADEKVRVFIKEIEAFDYVGEEGKIHILLRGIKLVELVDCVCWGLVELINGTVNTVNDVLFFFLISTQSY
ncbi:hypothetical protein LAZ67_3003117 [Cordylochernes scorpioides]|uniref:Uncharacterized protein n=1 Tax=Cordylochernes scorpioides TaxID=51811 RepID=A0ABY6K8W1_9ARAC|nr:hypothetical protein LAZ67_3003117 [Cordylochernes scorpioides]